MVENSIRCYYLTLNWGENNFVEISIRVEDWQWWFFPDMDKNDKEMFKWIENMRDNNEC